ncbi:hypothetical protein BJY04DRAFT_220801 [Aspergillus karnatakaensis]|uniref:uncharacterized protein n=1 Tax=Aspergillus karnatakaensis TaxID=1810916 RepID=UPI003CCD5568
MVRGIQALRISSFTRCREMVIVEINVRNESGRGEEEFLRAAIDDALDGNIISQSCFEQLQRALLLSRTTLNEPKAFVDSYGTSYTLNSKVKLLMGPENGSWTDPASFYISDSGLTGGHQVVLAQRFRNKFRLRDDGKETFGAAPSVIYNRNAKDEKKWEEEAKKIKEQKRKEAQELEAKLKKDNADKDRQNGQSTSTAV